LLAILLAVTPLQTFAEERVASPAIEVLAGSPPRNYPIRVYVYSQAYVTEWSQDIFVCEWTDQIVSTLYESLRDLRGSILRFIDDHPEYRELALIYFVNASTPNEADITFKVVSMIAANSTFYGVAYFGDKPVEIAVVCRMADRGRETIYNVVLHELMHALGLGHARQRFTENLAPELMWPGPSTRAKQYPTTLDLYALYMVHFGSTSGGVITLPSNLRYEMVIPYGREIQILKQENQKLRDQLGTSTMLFERMKQERDALRDKLAEANATLQDLSEQYQAIQNILDSYIRAYNTLQQKYENLRGNCSTLLTVCNQTYHELIAKLNEKHAALVNMTQRYNQCANQFNRLYEEHQRLQTDYDDMSWRFSFLSATYFAVVVILGGFGLWFLRRYNSLVEELERLEGGEQK
jgi:regulator of replication initiation timing